MAKPTRPRPRRKPAVKIDKVRIAKVKVDKVRAKRAKVDNVEAERAKLVKAQVEGKCSGCSAERTERIRRQAALFGLAAAISD